MAGRRRVLPPRGFFWRVLRMARKARPKNQPPTTRGGEGLHGGQPPPPKPRVKATPGFRSELQSTRAPTVDNFSGGCRWAGVTFGSRSAATAACDFRCQILVSPVFQLNFSYKPPGSAIGLDPGAAGGTPVCRQGVAPQVLTCRALVTGATGPSRCWQPRRRGHLSAGFRWGGLPPVSRLRLAAEPSRHRCGAGGLAFRLAPSPPRQG